MGKGLEDFAMQQAGTATSGLIGGAIGQIFAKANDKRQLRQQEKLQNLQIAGEKNMMDYSYEKQLGMWQKTSYPAQVEMLEKAGLNPGLLYGMGGGGGTTIGNPSANITGAEAPKGGGEQMGMAMQMMNLQLMKAQQKNIEADTANKLAEAANKPLQGENIKASTGSLTQGIENQKAQQKLTEIQTGISQLQYKLDASTMGIKQNILDTELSKNIEEIRQLRNQNSITEDTMKETIKQVALQNIKLGVETQLIKSQKLNTDESTELIKANIKKVDQEITNMTAEILNMSIQAGLKGQEIEVSKQRNEIEQQKTNIEALKAKYQPVWNVLGKHAEELTNYVTDQVQKLKKMLSF